MSEKKAVMKSMRDIITGMEGELVKAMPNQMDAGRLIRCVLSELRREPKLLACSWQSVVGALFTMGQIGLMPVGGQAHMIPFGKECVLVIGYQGYKELFYRHDLALSLSMDTVYDGDIFDHAYGTEPYIRHVPKEKTTTPLYHYAIATMHGGGKAFVVWSHKKCLDHGRKHSKTFNSKTSPWQTSTIAMCQKTMLLQLSKRIPLSYDLRRAIEADESIRKYTPGTADFMELPNTAWEDVSSDQKREFIPPEEMQQQEPPPEAEPAKEPNGTGTLFDKKQSKKKPGQHLYDLVSELYEEIAEQKGQQAEAWLKDNGFPEKNKVTSREQYQELLEKWKERPE